MNERQSRDSNRGTTNAGSTRTNSCVFRGRYDRQRTLAIRIAAITLASDSAITIARFRPSKDGTDSWGRLWLFLGSSRRFPGKISGQFRENLSHITEDPQSMIRRASGTGTSKPALSPWVEPALNIIFCANDGLLSKSRADVPISLQTWRRHMMI